MNIKEDKMKHDQSHKHIHKVIRKHAPKSVHKLKRLFSFKYPKLFLLILAIILAYYVFSHQGVQDTISGLDRMNYLGIFIAGILIVFGFSSPFSVGFFIVSQPDSLLLAALVGGIGAVVGDLLIFKTIKVSFMDEFKELEKTTILKTIRNAVNHNRNILIRHYLFYIFAGIIIALPLIPDEIGVSMLAGLTTINPKKLALMAFILHSIAIFLILYFSFVF